MTQDSCLAAEFSEDLPTLLKLCSENTDVDEICTDLELLGQELAQFSKPERLQYRRGYLDAKESYLALRQELIEILQSTTGTKTV